jgi:hypothetical protein
MKCLSTAWTNCSFEGLGLTSTYLTIMARNLSWWKLQDDRKNCEFTLKLKPFLGENIKLTRLKCLQYLHRDVVSNLLRLTLCTIGQENRMLFKGIIKILSNISSILPHIETDTSIKTTTVNLNSPANLKSLQIPRTKRMALR